MEPIANTASGNDMQDLLTAIYLVFMEIKNVVSDFVWWFFLWLDTQKILVLSIVTLSVMTGFYIMLHYRQIRFLAEIEHKKLMRDIADAVYGPLLNALHELMDIARHFDKTEKDGTLQVDWSWKRIKQRDPYLSLQIPRLLHEQFDHFSGIFERYKRLRPHILTVVRNIATAKFGTIQPFVQVDFLSKDKICLDSKPAEFFVFSDMELRDYADKIREIYGVKAPVEIQIRTEGLSHEKLGIPEFDKKIQEVRDEIFSYSDADFFFKLQNTVIKMSNQLYQEIEDALRNL